MSMQTDCVYGYGFYIHASDDQLKKFLETHKETVKSLPTGAKILEYMDSRSGDSFNPKEDFYDYSSELNCGNEGFYGIVSDVMYTETGIRWCYMRAQDEDDGDDSILFTESQPWHLNPVEKELTLERAEEICKKYITDLDAANQLVPDYIRMEYFG